MRFFRLLHRRTKSENDVSTFLSHPPCSSGITAPVFVPLQMSLPSFDPTHELYTLHNDPLQVPLGPGYSDKLNTRITQLESQLAQVQAECSTLEQDLADYRADLLNTRTELYSEMLCSARLQQRTMDDFRTIQKLEARNQRFCALLVDIGIPRSTVDVICQSIESGNGPPDDILVNAIRIASDDSNTLLAKLKPIVKDERTPEHYQSALNLTLSIRKELKCQKKRCKFWKNLAQNDDWHASTVTPSPSDISSIHLDLSPERQSALDALVARRRAVRDSEDADSDVFGDRRGESALDMLANSLASRSRHSTQYELRLSSSFSSSASSASTKHFSRISGLSRIPMDLTMETLAIPLHLPSPSSVSLRRPFRSASQPIVLGSVDMNVSRSSSVNPALQEETDQNPRPETGSGPTVTRSQDLFQNDRRASQGQGHRRMPSTASRRHASTRSSRSSFRLSALSPVRQCRPVGPLTALDSNISGNTTIDISTFCTPDNMMRLSDLATGTNTPASSEVTQSEDTPFNDARALPKYGAETPLSSTELVPRVASTPLHEYVTCKPLSRNIHTHDTWFSAHLDSPMSMSKSMHTPASESGTGAHGERCERDDTHITTDSCTDGTTIPMGESKDSLFTMSASSLSADETSAPTTPPTPNAGPAPALCGISPGATGKASVGRSMLPILAKHLRRLSLSGGSPERERLMDKLRGLRPLSRSRSRSRPHSSPGEPLGSPPVGVWRGSPARSEPSRSENTTPSPSPVKGSGIPVLQRRMTVRARRTSVRKV